MTHTYTLALRIITLVCFAFFVVLHHFASLHLSLAGSAPHNVIDSQDHLRRFGGRDEGLLFNAQALSNAECNHIINLAIKHINAGREFSINNLRSESGHQIGSVVATILANNAWQLSQGTCKGLNSQGLLAVLLLG